MVIFTKNPLPAMRFPAKKAPMDEQDQPGNSKPRWRRFKAPAGYLFWVWIGYQAVKGTLTTAFIWGPMIYLWFTHHPG